MDLGFEIGTGYKHRINVLYGMPAYKLDCLIQGTTKPTCSHLEKIIFSGGFSFTPLCSPVLKPDLHPRLTQI